MGAYLQLDHSYCHSVGAYFCSTFVSAIRFDCELSFPTESCLSFSFTVVITLQAAAPPAIYHPSKLSSSASVAWQAGVFSFDPAFHSLQVTSVPVVASSESKLLDHKIFRLLGLPPTEEEWGVAPVAECRIALNFGFSASHVSPSPRKLRLKQPDCLPSSLTSFKALLPPPALTHFAHSHSFSKLDIFPNPPAV